MPLLRLKTIARRERERQDTLAWLTGDFDLGVVLSAAIVKRLPKLRGQRKVKPFTTALVTKADVEEADRMVAKAAKRLQRRTGLAATLR